MSKYYKELYEEVRLMRRAYKLYFRTRDRLMLIDAKTHESKVDGLLMLIKNENDESKNNDLE